MGDKLINKMEFPFKETPEVYLEDSKVKFFNEFFDNNELEELLSLYMDSFYLRKSKFYNEFQEKYKEFMECLNEDPEFKDIIEDYFFSENMNEYEFEEDELYYESTSIEINSDIKNKVEDKYPVYIIFNNSTSWYSKLITKFTKGDYSHASLSLSGVDEMISFEGDPTENGLIVENFYEMLSRRKPEYIKINALMVTEEQYIKIAKLVKKFKQNAKQYKYNYKGIVTFHLKKVMNKVQKTSQLTWENTHFFCSQFVGWLVANISNIVDDVNVSPVGLSKKIENSSDTLTVFDGVVDDFNVNLVKDFEDLFRKQKRRIRKKLQPATKQLEIDNDAIDKMFLKESVEISSSSNRRITDMSKIIYGGYPDDDNNSKYNFSLNTLVMPK